MKLCLALITDKFDADLRTLLKGVWLNQRSKYDKVSLWTSDCMENLDKQHRIGRQMKDILNLTFMVVIVYEPHETSIQMKRDAEMEAAAAAAAEKKRLQKKSAENSTNKKRQT